jgi:ABC-type Fe3+-hydroxamate transport system substrate-binding protein
MVSSIRDRLPAEGERPTVALVIYNPDQKTFGTYEINGPGFAKAHYRPLNPVGAFADSDKTYANDYSDVDLEEMLEIDPDVLIHHWDIEPSDRFEALLALEDDPVGKELTALQNDRVYVGGTPMQGPIFNLFQLETAAQQIYPEEFGEFRGVGETPEENELFDRQRVADIVNGDV